MSSPFIAILLREQNGHRYHEVLHALAAAAEKMSAVSPSEIRLREDNDEKPPVAIVKFTKTALSMETSGIVTILLEQLKQQNIEGLTYRRVANAVEDSLMEINLKSNFGDALRFPDGTLWRKC